VSQVKRNPDVEAIHELPSPAGGKWRTAYHLIVRRGTAWLRYLVSFLAYHFEENSLKKNSKITDHRV
jgi:hypothetical protein